MSGSTDPRGWSHLDALSTHSAPPRPGVYAWYSSIVVSELDCTGLAGEAEAQVKARYLELLSMHTAAMRPDSMSLLARGSFGRAWRGVLSERKLDASQGEFPNDALARASESLAGRLALSEVLRGALPVFASPLYVGVATSLRRRLQQHANALLRLDERCDREPGFRDRLARRGRQTFATRAVSRGISPNSLTVFFAETPVSSIESSGLSPKEIARAAEWLLNQWNHPILGRR